MVSVSHDEKVKSDMGSSSTNAAVPSSTTKRASTRNDEVEATTVGVPTVKVWRDKLKVSFLVLPSQVMFFELVPKQNLLQLCLPT